MDKRAMMSLRGQMGGLAFVAKHGPNAHVEAMLRGKQKRYERIVDPDGVLPVEERRARARAAELLEMKRLVLAREQKRRLRAQ